MGVGEIEVRTWGEAGEFEDFEACEGALGGHVCWRVGAWSGSTTVEVLDWSWTPRCLGWGRLHAASLLSATWLIFRTGLSSFLGRGTEAVECGELASSGASHGRDV